MAGFDQRPVVGLDLGLRADGDDVVNPEFGDDQQVSNTNARVQFQSFLSTYRVDHQFIYRDQLRANHEQRDYRLAVDVTDLRAFSPTLAELIQLQPVKYHPIFEEAAKEIVRSFTLPRPENVPDIQIELKNYPQVTSIRTLAADDVSKLVCLHGMCVSASRVALKATKIVIRCSNCKATKLIPCSAGFGGAQVPRDCDTQFVPDSGLKKCPPFSYQVVADSSMYIDQQRLKLQENVESVPTGEMPRHVSCSVDRYLVGTVKPGTRITIIGIYTTFQSKSGGRQGPGGNRNAETSIRIPYVRVLGIESETDTGHGLAGGNFSPADDEEMHNISRMPDLYARISKSIAPAIWGSDDIKRALACQLFGGSPKQLPDGMRLRGDINVLLLGDPSTAKSQFLKFVVDLAPIGVYTSGKGSSAAGLTASVLRDPGSGEFHLEGGALVLADGGLVCIDEFDKMREQDRVAIHEAMEQQTISIAKAGITTVLNSRASVLAAANPIFGRYDDMKTPTENIDFQSTILSRFDLIFIVRDIQHEDRDSNLARHIIDVHRRRDAALQRDLSFDIFEVDTLKKYVAFARQRCKPRLSEEAAKTLKNRYVRFRTEMRNHKRTHGMSAIPITVRQLEAIIRLSESLAKMQLAEVATVEHVQEAIRLFQVSTFQAAVTGFGDGSGVRGFDKKIKAAERYLTQRVSVGNDIPTARLLREMLAKNYEEAAVMKAIEMMVQRGKFRYKNQRKTLTKMRA